MALPKVCGIETEYGIVVRGGDNNPVVGVVGADQRLRRRHQPRARSDRLGLRGRVARPTTPAASRSTTRWHPRSRRRSSTPCSPTAPATTSTTPIPRSPRPRCATAREVVRWDRAAEEIVRGARCSTPAALLPDGGRDHRPQEQLRRQGQQLRLPRELPARPRDAVRPASSPRSPRTSSPARSSPAPARSAASCPASRRPRAVPAQPAGRLLRGGGRPRDHAQAPDRQHPRRAALRRPEVPPAARHRRRRQHERGRHLPQGRHHGDRAGDDRGRRARRRAGCSATRSPAIRQVSHDPTLRARSCSATAGGPRRSRSSGVSSSGPASTSSRTGWRASARRSASTCCDRWEQVLTGLEQRPRLGRPVGRLGRQAAARRRVRRASRARTRLGPAEGDRPAVPRPARRPLPRRSRAGLDTLVDPRRGRRRR